MVSHSHNPDRVSWRAHGTATLGRCRVPLTGWHPPWLQRPVMWMGLLGPPHRTSIPIHSTVTGWVDSQPSSLSPRVGSPGHGSRIKDGGQASAPEGPCHPSAAWRYPRPSGRQDIICFCPGREHGPLRPPGASLEGGPCPPGTRDLAQVEAHLPPYRWGRWAGPRGGAGTGLDVTTRAGSLP